MAGVMEMPAAVFLSPAPDSNLALNAWPFVVAHNSTSRQLVFDLGLKTCISDYSSATRSTFDSTSIRPELPNRRLGKETLRHWGWPPDDTLETGVPVDNLWSINIRFCHVLSNRIWLDKYLCSCRTEVGKS
jgi:hypothetical protein